MDESFPKAEVEPKLKQIEAQTGDRARQFITVMGMLAILRVKHHWKYTFPSNYKSRYWSPVELAYSKDGFSGSKDDLFLGRSP